MRIFLEKNDKLEQVYEGIAQQKNISIIQDDISNIYNLLEKGDVLFIYCDSIEDINKYKRFKDVYILVVTQNSNVNFLYSVLQILHPIDIVFFSTNIDAINVRIKSNLDILKGEFYEKDYMYNDDVCNN